MSNTTVGSPRIVSREEWIAERKALLIKEKELTRASDELARQRRQLAWVRIEKSYLFEGPNGEESLSSLFEGHSQLIVKHFMMGPGWGEGCVGCSFDADHVDGAVLHLSQHDVSYVAVSRAPLAEIEAFQKRMGWRFKWVSSYGSDFNYDFHVSFPKDANEVYYNYQPRKFESEELPGHSIFYKDESGTVFHTYSCYARGNEKAVSTYVYLDLTPKGRNEDRGLTDWVRHHDRYESKGRVAPNGRYESEQASECGCKACDAIPTQRATSSAT